MKNSLKSISLVFVVLASFAVSSCAKDDGSDLSYKEKAIGTWYEYSYTADDMSYQYPMATQFYRFNENGTVDYSFSGAVFENYFTWTIEGNKLTLKSTDQELTPPVWEYTIAEMTLDRWVLEGTRLPGVWDDYHEVQVVWKKKK